MKTTSDEILMRDSGFGKGYDYPPSLLEQLIAKFGAVLKKGFQSLLWIILGIVGWATSRAPRSHIKLTPATFHPKRILVVRTDMLGDVVLTMPAIRALHQSYPDAELDMVLLPSSAGIVQGQPGITTIFTCDPNNWLGAIVDGGVRREVQELVSSLRSRHYDLGVSICGDWGSIITRLSGAKRRVGYADEAYPYFMTDPVSGGRYTIRQHEIYYGLSLAKHAGGDIEADNQYPSLAVSLSARERISQLFQTHGIDSGQKVIAFHVGSRNGQAKRWPLPLWAQLADMVISQYPEFVIVLVGAPNDKALAQSVLHRIHTHKKVIDLTGETNLQELIALLKQAMVIVTGDSGPLHIAEAVGTRVVAIHGPTDPLLSGPCHPTSIVLWREIWCAPCYDHKATAECRFSNPVCMKGITVQQVMESICQQINIIC
jgi:lipopolysaccharide heptosyltransferase II